MSGGVGVPAGGGPDRWDRLWTPHRLQYIKGENRPSAAEDPEGAPECPFCRVPTMSEPESLIVYRGVTAYVVLNLYPYNPGHLLVCPYRHLPMYTDIDETEVAEIADLTRKAMVALREASRPHGFNIGMNQGAIGGAGVAEHLHQHVVPRWGGDMNFMPIVGGTKTMPMLLEDTRDLIAEYWPQ